MRLSELTMARQTSTRDLIHHLCNCSNTLLGVFRPFSDSYHIFTKWKNKELGAPQLQLCDITRNVRYHKVATEEPLIWVNYFRGNSKKIRFSHKDQAQNHPKWAGKFKLLSWINRCF